MQTQGKDQVEWRPLAQVERQTEQDQSQALVAQAEAPLSPLMSEASHRVYSRLANLTLGTGTAAETCWIPAAPTQGAGMGAEVDWSSAGVKNAMNSV